MNKIELIKAAGYINSDRINQKEREFELELQRKRIENFCRKNNLELVKIYKEPYSSKPDYRPGLSLLFSESKQKMFENFSEYDIIINLNFNPPWSPDRISAKGKEFLNK